MLTLHHLNNSRSQRILWLLEELGLPYEMKRYQRNATTRLAPPELEAVHPLGKSPVITDGDIKIAESGAIVDYIIRTYGKGAMMPAPGSAEFEPYNEWLHYSEGSAMLPLMLNLYVSRLKEAGAPLHPRIDSETKNHLGYVDGALKGREFFIGNVADRRRYPDELCRRDGKSVRQARAVSEPDGVARANARAAGVPALGREGRGVPVCEVTHRRHSGMRSGADPDLCNSHIGNRANTGFDGSHRPRNDRPGSRPGRRRRGLALGVARRGGHGKTPIPTISCTNSRRAPQALGHCRPIWYPASAASDRHT